MPGFSIAPVLDILVSDEGTNQGALLSPGARIVFIQPVSGELASPLKAKESVYDAHQENVGH